jgi:lipopolysaccharide/colanic/teichoic acid biosynthesis glycosyltransferase
MSDTVRRKRMHTFANGRAPGVGDFAPLPELSGAVRPVAWWRSEGMRRAANVLVAAVALVLVLPAMLVVALLVWATSPGPILYRQTRIGIDRRSGLEPSLNHRRKSDLGGKPFTIYKFRTMHVAPQGAEQSQVWARPDDPRITRVGRVLRKYRLDELPQLFNVLLGDMNLVGPRPEQPLIFAELREQIDQYHHRQQVLPGITGWAQINQHYDASIDDVRKKVQFDLEYIEQRSPMHDLKILLRTVPVVVFKRGAW